MFKIIKAAPLALCALLALRSPAIGDDNYFDLSLEELSSLTITSVSRRPEEASKAASAVFVLTGDEIRRSGATSIPDALRLVPGLEVARGSTRSWAVTSRGFNNLYAMKLLVMIDGRTVYKTLFSGVEWDEQLVFMEDIERIEVIRGPGASLWGANAVNGVINIITKSSKDTQGTYAYTGTGNEEYAYGGARHGGLLNENAWYRVFGDFTQWDGLTMLSDENSPQDAWASHGGFRIDAQPSSSDLLTWQADGSYGRTFQVYESDDLIQRLDPSINSKSAPVGSANTLVRWTRSLPQDSEIQLQSYYAHLERDNKVISEQIGTYDLDFQYRLPGWGAHSLMWGAGYRNDRDTTKGTYEISLSPSDRSLNLYTGFIQDEISLVPDRLRLIAGVKLEHNEFTGYETQPTIRAAWTPSDAATLWASASRAVRTPSRLEHDAIMYYGGATDNPFGVPIVVRMFGNPGAEAENVYSYETGWRYRFSDAVSIDTAAFYSQYRDHLSFELQQPHPVDEPIRHIVAPLTPMNRLAFRSNGIETALTVQPLADWRLIGTYTYLNIEYDYRSTTNIDVTKAITRESPAHQVGLRSIFNVTKQIDFDAFLRYVGPIVVGRYDDATSSALHIVPDYSELNLRLAWRPKKQLEFQLIGTDLLHSRHAEWAQGSLNSPNYEVDRAVYVKVSSQF